MTTGLKPDANIACATNILQCRYLFSEDDFFQLSLFTFVLGINWVSKYVSDTCSIVISPHSAKNTKMVNYADMPLICLCLI